MYKSKSTLKKILADLNYQFCIFYLMKEIRKYYVHIMYKRLVDMIPVQKKSIF